VDGVRVLWRDRAGGADGSEFVFVVEEEYVFDI
jgi:hypothetical protein